ncbi:capsular biosynthesis protein [soil metagenome]
MSTNPEAIPATPEALSRDGKVVSIAVARATHFLFLQGLPGPFFRRLAKRLRASGKRVSRVNFNGGDMLDWRMGGARRYHGGLAHWPDWLESHVHGEAVTDIILFGDCRPLHRAAIEVARRCGVRVHVFEEGYLRPHHVTLERSGVNGFSALPRTIGDIRKIAAGDAIEPVAVEGNFARRARDASLHYLGVFLASPAFPTYRTHRARSFIHEALGWVSRYVRRRRESAASAADLGRIAGRPFFLLPMQLDGDAQLRFHSRHDSMEEALRLILLSFADHAPADRALVVKMHPLDPDLGHWRRRIRRLASDLAISGRVAFVERADLDPLLDAASGVVTVNSTVGPLALARGIPVHAIGQAIYAIDGLTHGGPLDAFWRAPGTVDAHNYAAFRAALMRTCLINGGFHSEGALELLVANSARRLLHR